MCVQEESRTLDSEYVSGFSFSLPASHSFTSSVERSKGQPCRQQDDANFNVCVCKLCCCSSLASPPAVSVAETSVSNKGSTGKQTRAEAHVSLIKCIVLCVCVCLCVMCVCVCVYRRIQIHSSPSLKVECVIQM